MGGEWREVQLGDVTDLVTGYPFKSQHYTDDPSDPRLIGGDNIVQGSLRWDNVRRWPRIMTDGLAAYWLRCDDVVLAMDRPWIDAGLKRATIRDHDLPALLIQRTARLRGTNELDTTFLRYVIGSRAFTQHVLGVQTGTAVPHISPSQIRAFRFLLPPLRAQRAIARILGALDDKIELNRKMNATLEAVARALFKSWFQEQSETGGLDEKLVSDLTADGVLQVGDGYRAKNDEMASEGLPFARAGNIDNGFDFAGADLLGSPGVSKAGDKVSRTCDVVFTSKGTVGRFAFVDPAMQAFVYSPQLCFWRSTDHAALSPFVLRQWMASRWFLDQVDRVKGQTDMAEYVSLRDQRAMRFPLATPESQVAIGAQLAELQRLVWKNERETHALARIRDHLLPRLLSGELPVDAAERSVEEVA
ncbi:MAG: hypothetical protein AMXMBFR56_75710 [Polyangiaceae bacterium]